MKLKPLLKWAGGKTVLLDKLFNKFPKEILTYKEPFLGGGSVLFELLNRLENNKIKIHNKIQVNDYNSTLINFYKSIKNLPKEFIESIEEISGYYNSAEMLVYPKRYNFDKDITNDMNISDIIEKGKQFVYYYYRRVFNTTEDEFLKSVLLLFLNKTSFRGLYREGPNGFNVPFGNYKTPGIYDKKQIMYTSKLLNKYKVEFYNRDFVRFCKYMRIGCFMYLDPPYYPVENTSFVNYNKDGFKDGNERLYELCVRLKNKISFVQSNSDSDWVKDKYKGFNIEEVECPRRINSKNSGSKTIELLISN